MNTEDVELVEELGEVARKLRRTGIAIPVLISTASILFYIREPWAIIVGSMFLGIVNVLGLNQAIGAHIVVKEIKKAAMDALLTPHRDAR